MPEIQKQRGRVIANYGTITTVQSEDNKLYRCKSHRNRTKPICGDNVEFILENASEGIIKTVLPRNTLLSRHRFNKPINPLAANVTQLLIVSADPPGIQFGLINNYLVAAELTSLQPILVFNKMDLLSPKQVTQQQDDAILYQEIGYHVIFSDVKSKEGIASLKQVLTNHVSILVGRSGAGKSSLIKALLPDLEIRIGELSKATQEGKHTTTTTTLYTNLTNGDLIDSPGVRQFGLWQLDKKEVANGYIEFQPLIEKCKYSDCLHINEPDCAISSAVNDGKINKTRYLHYQSLVKSLDKKKPLFR